MARAPIKKRASDPELVPETETTPPMLVTRSKKKIKQPDVKLLERQAMGRRRDVI